MRKRKRVLEERPKRFRDFLERLVAALGPRASVLVFGGRARTGLNSVEPRDYDLLIVVETPEDIEKTEELAYSLRPRGLPLDIIVMHRNQLGNPLVQQMLEHHIVLHDPLGVEKLLAHRGYPGRAEPSKPPPRKGDPGRGSGEMA